MPLQMSIPQTLIKIKTYLDRREEPFLGYIAKFHKFIELTPEEVSAVDQRPANQRDEGWGFLMGVDAEANIYYNPTDCAKLSEQQLCGVVAHELMHTVLRHVSRTPKHFNKLIANVAQDIVVNWHCVRMGFKLPYSDSNWNLMPQTYRSDSVKFRVKQCNHEDENNCSSKCYIQIEIDAISNKTWMQIYHEIMAALSKTPKINSKNSILIMGGGKAQTGSTSKGGEFNPVIKEQFDSHDFSDSAPSNSTTNPGSERYWKFKLAEAYAYCKQRGSNSGHLMTMIGELLEPKIHWKDILRSCIIAGIGEDISWRKPRRNALCRGIYLPISYSEEVKIICAIDSSGSISNQQLKEFVSEVAAILTTYPRVDLTVLVCDCTLKEYFYTERDLEDIKNIPMHGRGGTSHAPIVSWIQKNKPDAKILVAFTDGYSDIESEFPKLPGDLRKIIALSERAASMRTNMEQYGEVIDVYRD